MPETGYDPVTVIDSRLSRKPLPIVRGAGEAFAVLSPDNGAHFRTFNVVDLKAGDTTRELCHASECVYYVESGVGQIVDAEAGTGQPLVEGSMIHIGVGDSYRLEAGTAGMRLVGGCVPVDPALYDLMPEEATA